MAATLVTAAGASGVQGPMSGGRDVNAEDVLDLITNITPWETPVITILPKVQATNTRHEWVVDNFVSPTAWHNLSEGIDFGSGKDAYNARTRRANWLQHFRYEVKVSNLQRVMNPFGVQDEYAYQVGKAAKGCGYDMEFCILADSFVSDAANLRGLETNVNRMKKLIELISEEDTTVTPDATLINNIVDSNTMVGLTTTAATKIYDIAVAPIIAAQSNLTETKIMKMQEIILGSSTNGGGHPDTVICSPAVFGQWASFGVTLNNFGYQVPALQVNLDAALKKIVRAVRFYDGQYGILQVVMSRWCPQGTNAVGATAFNRQTNCGFVYFIERNKTRLAFGRPVQHVPVPPAGDATRGMVLADVTLELLSSFSAGAIAAVNNVMN